MSLSLFALDAACGERWPWTTSAGPALGYARWIATVSVLALALRAMPRRAAAQGAVAR